MNNSFNLIAFMKLVWRWRKPVLIITAAGIIGSIIITDPHIMKPYFESTSLIYPMNPNLTNSSSLFGDNAQGYFGGSGDVDRILAMAESEPLKKYIIHKFDLYNHYDIDSAKVRYPIEAVMNELESNFTFEKNDKGAINITVQDHDPVVAAKMANEIVAKIDETNRELLNENKKKILSIYESKLHDKEIEVNNMTDSIFKLKQKYNLYGTIEDLPKQIQLMRSEMGAEYDAASEKVKILEEKKKGAVRELNNNTVLYEQYRSSINSSVPTVYILEKAFPAEKKSKPVRWLIVLGTAVSCFVLCTLAVLLIEIFKKIKTAFANA